MLKYGFFNALNHDRLYDAEEMSTIFNNIITDGVFDNYGKLFTARPGTGMQVIVGTGRAWFNSTWTFSDSDIALRVPSADVSLTRIDSVILEVDHSVGVRANSIKILKGTPSVNPVPPTLSNGKYVFQHALCNITIAPGTTAINAGMLDIRVGKSGCPYVTSVLKSVSIDSLFAKWEYDFTTWFDDLKSQLSGNIAANLQNQINALDTRIDNQDANINTQVNALNARIDSVLAIANEACKVETGSYTGAVAKNEDKTINFSGKPMLVILFSGHDYSGLNQFYDSPFFIMPNGTTNVKGFFLSASNWQRCQVQSGYPLVWGSTYLTMKKSEDGKSKDFNYSSSSNKPTKYKYIAIVK